MKFLPVKNKNKGLKGWQIAIIIVVVILILIAIGLVVALFLKKKTGKVNVIKL